MLGRFKAVVYIVPISSKSCMFLGVFRFAKNMKFLTKGGIRCISRVFPRHLYFMRGPSMVELTGYDNIAANIMVHINSKYLPYYVFIHG